MGKIYLCSTPNSDLAYNFAIEVLNYYEIEFETSLPQEIRDGLREKGVLKYNSFYKTWYFAITELDKARGLGEINIVLFVDDSDVQHWLVTSDKGIEILGDFLPLK